MRELKYSIGDRLLRTDLLAMSESHPVMKIIDVTKSGDYRWKWEDLNGNEDYFVITTNSETIDNLREIELINDEVITINATRCKYI